MLNFFKKMSVAVAVTLVVGFVSTPQLVLAKAGFPANTDMRNLTEMPVTMTEQEGKLLLSDSPEMVEADGIMYQDTVNGDTRLFFHHVNATKELKKIVVLLVNDSDTATDVVVHQHGLGGPGLDYMAVGKAAQMKYLKQEEIELIEVPAKGAALLEPILNKTVVAPDELVNGIYDFQSKRPIKVVIMMLPVDADPAAFAAKASVLPNTNHRLRGTFSGRDRLLVPSQVYNSATDGVMAITLADNKIDTYVSGIDATDGSKTLNFGNYGVMYKLFLPTAFAQNYAVYLNPRGGQYAGGMKVKYRHQEENTTGTPADKLFFGNQTNNDVAYLGDFVGGQSLWLTFSPPGASNLPVKLILAPVAKN